MLNVRKSTPTVLCDRVSRREWLRVGGLGVLGLSLPNLLRAEDGQDGATGASRKAVILIWLSGGPSHLDTWDPKPDTPSEVRGTFGMFDNHGDGHFAGGLVRGLGPLLGRVDQATSALVADLEARGLLESTLVLVPGEFGRAPVVNRDAGRDHWFNCMSMLVAGGGLAHGQVIGSTDARGYDVRDARVVPADLAATVFRHLEIDLGAQWTDLQGRPQSIVAAGGRPIPELSRA